MLEHDDGSPRSAVSSTPIGTTGTPYNGAPGERATKGNRHHDHQSRPFSCCTLAHSDDRRPSGADHCCTPVTHTDVAGALDELLEEEIPADVAAIRSAGFRMLLETGQPVAVDDLIAATGIAADRVNEILVSVRARGRVELDSDGHLIGIAGLSPPDTNSPSATTPAGRGAPSLPSASSAPWAPPAPSDPPTHRPVRASISSSSTDHPTPTPSSSSSTTTPTAGSERTGAPWELFRHARSRTGVDRRQQTRRQHRGSATSPETQPTYGGPSSTQIPPRTADGPSIGRTQDAPATTPRPHDNQR